MNSIPFDIIGDVLDRMLAEPLMVFYSKNIRVDHRTVLTRDNAPAIHIVPGELIPGKETDCRQDWQMLVSVCVFVRDDAARAVADPILSEAMRRLDSRLSPSYPHDARLRVVRVRPEPDIADGDALRTDIDLRFDFETAPWDLDSEAGP